MDSLLSPELFTNAGAVVGFLLFLTYLLKQVIDWWRGDKSVEQGWRSQTLTDAMAGHNMLKGMYETVQQRVEHLEEDLEEAKRREQVLVEQHRREIAELRSQYIAQITELEYRIDHLTQELREWKRDS